MKRIKNLNEQREFLYKRLKEIDAQENQIRAELGMELIPEHTTKRHRMKKDEVLAIRAAILNAMPASKWVTMAHIVNEVFIDVDDDIVRQQLRALEKDTNSPVAHNGVRARGSRYCLMNEDGSTPAQREPEDHKTLVVKAFKDLLHSGTAIVNRSDILDKLFECEEFDEMGVDMIMSLVRDTKGVRSNNQEGESEAFCYLG